jgi:hypothetical protein
MSNLNTNKRKGKLYVRKFTALIFMSLFSGNNIGKKDILVSNVISNLNSSTYL